MNFREQQQLATAIYCSPRRERSFTFCCPPFRRAFAEWRCPTEVLSISSLRRWADFARGAFGLPVVWQVRRSAAFAGIHVYPPSKDISELLGLAAVGAASTPMPVRAGLAGVAALTIHPFEDGNGRTCRFLWSLGLKQCGFSVDEIVTTITEFYGPQGLEAYPTLVAASTADLNPFLARWSAIVAR